jgi:hypothetical protein
MQADPIGLPDRFTIPIDSWQIMTGELLAAVVRGAGSIRRAARVIDVPKSTLSACFACTASAARGQRDEPPLLLGAVGWS